MNNKITKLLNYEITKLNSNSVIQLFSNSVIRSKRSFTLVELIVSVGLLLTALSIALFAVVSTSGLIQRTDARGVVSEGGRSVSESIRRATTNAPIGAIAREELISGELYAAVRIKKYSPEQSSIICTTIGRAKLTNPIEQTGGEETYTIDKNGPLVAILIHTVDQGGGCPNSTSPALYQNRLTSIKTSVNTLSFYLQTVPCRPVAPPCVPKQFLRYSLDLQQIAKEAGLAEQSRSPSITLSDGVSVGLINDSITALSVETSSPLPNGRVGDSYSQTLNSSGGVPDYTWSLAAGSPALPGGLTLSASGLLSGTPETEATTALIVKVTDSLNSQATKPLSITITAPAAPVSITTSTLSPASATEGVLYTSSAITADGGSGSYIWSLDPGSPDWLKIGTISGCLADGSTGIVCGTPPSGSGTAYFKFKWLADSAIAAPIGPPPPPPPPTGVSYSVYVRVTDANDPTNTDTKTFTLIVNPPGGLGSD